MVAFNFKAQFADAVERGVKRQTIRAIRKDGRVPHIGSALQLYTGMRTKNCRKLKDAVCTNVWPITIASKSITINRQRWNWIDMHDVRVRMMDLKASQRCGNGSRTFTACRSPAT